MGLPGVPLHRLNSWRIHSRGRPSSRLVSTALASCRPFGQPLAGGRSCSASAVSHRCDGFLCARSYGLVASRFRSWGSLRFRFGSRRSEDLHAQHLAVLSRRGSEELRPGVQLLLSSCLRAVRPCPPAVPLPGRWPCSTVRRLPSGPHRGGSFRGRRFPFRARGLWEVRLRQLSCSAHTLRSVPLVDSLVQVRTLSGPFSPRREVWTRRSAPGALRPRFTFRRAFTLSLACLSLCSVHRVRRLGASPPKGPRSAPASGVPVSNDARLVLSPWPKPGFLPPLGLCHRHRACACCQLRSEDRPLLWARCLRLSPFTAGVASLVRSTGFPPDRLGPVPRPCARPGAPCIPPSPALRSAHPFRRR
jgi:hypothetical protein